jgi:hypothetical protein
MRRVLISRSILMLVAIGFAPAQIMNRVEKAPHIIIRLPDNIASDSVTIWYGLMGQEGRAGPVRREPDIRQYTIDAEIGRPPIAMNRIASFERKSTCEGYVIFSEFADGVVYPDLISLRVKGKPEVIPEREQAGYFLAVV